MRLLVQAAEPPLQPSGDDARSLLRRELLRPEYNDQALITRFVDWLRDQLTKGLDVASASPPWATLGAMVVGVALLGALGWLLSRTRGSAHVRPRRAPALGEERLGAAELRARAEAALAGGHAEAALLDAFRAVAMRQIERGRVEEVPGATAHELAGLLGQAFPTLAGRVAAAADRFDLVLYGDRSASPEQARAVLALDDELVAAR